MRVTFKLANSKEFFGFDVETRKAAMRAASQAMATGITILGQWAFPVSEGRLAPIPPECIESIHIDLTEGEAG